MSKVPAWRLPKGWNTKSGASQNIKALRIQRGQSATLEQQMGLLEDLFSCIELDVALCRVDTAVHL